MGVVLCASTVKSPQLLMLSGVGPRDELEKWKISPVKILEGVGRNIRDHPNAFLQVPLRDDVPVGDTDGNKVGIQSWHIRYTAPKIGAHQDILPSDMMVFAGPTQGLVRVRGSKTAIRAFNIGIVLNLARSQGRLTLTSADPKDKPRIDYNYLSDPTDLPRLREGVRRGLKILYSKEMEAVVGGLETHGLTESSTDAEIDEFITKTLFTSWHTSGACKMGAASDPFAVCDEQARVYGVESLRVVDCGLMPDAVRANLQFTVYMMAERIAALMRHSGDLQEALREVHRLNAAPRGPPPEDL